MSLYADFLKETFNKNVYEDDQGFVSYGIDKDECYIENVYIKPEFRGHDIAAQMVRVIEKIALEKGCKYLSTTVNVGANNKERSIKVILDYGFKFLTCNEYKLVFGKEISNV